MTINRLQNQINKIDKEIANLENKRSLEEKKVANNEKKITGINISKKDSVTTIKSKQRNINQYRRLINNSKSKIADLSKKIAVVSKRRNDTNLKLQKAMVVDNKRRDTEVKNMYTKYAQRIEELENINVLSNTIRSETIKEDNVEYDVFVSHAWEDKEEFVDEFVYELKLIGVDVWYDETNTSWGSSLREEIDKGLQSSKFGIVILSPDYIAENKYWTKTELNGLFQMDSINSGTLLPIWHNLTKKQVLEYSPMIADKKAMTTAQLTPKEMANELFKLIKSVQ